MRTIQIGALVATLLLCGCQTNTRESTALQDNMGKAVAQMTRDQVSNPATLTGSQDQSVEGIDPEYATATLESMRKDIPERSAVKRDILINVGTNTPSGN